MARVMMWVSQEFQGTTTATINIRHFSFILAKCTPYTLQ